tara:strand:+ start:98 stop:421 length:324 start_codon:yes stop_codon:yes gene_type:complete
MTNYPVQNPNDVLIIIHPILDKKGKWTKQVYLSIAHSQHATLPKEDIYEVQELAALGCSAIHSVGSEGWLRDYLEEEIFKLEENRKSYTVNDNVIKLNFGTETEGEA